MNGPGHHHQAFDTVDRGAGSYRLRRRASASRSLLFVAIALITVVGPALIFAAGQAGGQAAKHGPKPAGAPVGNAGNGKQIFVRYGCYECHGSHGQIVSRTGPALAPDLVAFEGFTTYVRHPAGSMPPYAEKVVSEQDLADIYAFLQSASRPPASKSIPLLNSIGGKP
jgi:mono/diheme cytochrome c family protein